MLMYKNVYIYIYIFFFFKVYVYAHRCLDLVCQQVSVSGRGSRFGVKPGDAFLGS